MDSENVCDLSYLNEIMKGKKNLMLGIMDVFLKQVPEELQSINEAITLQDFAIIKSVAHKMRSTVFIMGISLLTPVLKEMEELAAVAVDDSSTSDSSVAERIATGIGKIIQLNHKLNLICKQAIEEIEKEKISYV